MTGQQLRNSILQEAIQGRLVPNVLQPGEKTGEELLKSILAERQKKENEEKGKKAKKLTLSTIEEEPWELPEGWCWCKLGDLVYMISGTSYGKGDVLSGKTDSCIRILRGGNIIDEQILYCADDVFIPASFVDKTKAIKKNDIVIIGSSGSKKAIAKASLAKEDDPSSQIGAFLRIIRNYNQSILPYVWMIFRSAYYKLYIADIVKGTNINNIKSEYIEQFDIPLPPLSIQKAIVEKIEELLPLIDEYDKAAGELETLNKILPDKLRKSVLQEAIHGSLVSNDIPEGEATGAELLQQILKERQDRENKEKGKKAKKLTLSTIEEEPWELPEGWCWCRGKDIFFPMESIKPKSDFVYIDTDAVNNKKNVIDNPKNVLFKNAPSRATRRLHANDILFSMVRPYLKNIAYVDERFASAIGTTGFYVITTSSSLYQPYIFKMMLSDYVVSGLTEYMKGDNSPSINNGHIEDFLYPIPPLSIQHRIVEKIEEVFAAIDNLPA